MQKPELNPLLFWDVDFLNLNYEAKARFVIERVLERGSLSDWKEIKRYYGLDKIKGAALEIRYLTKKTLNFCSIYFNIPITEFRCYKLQQFTPPLWQL